MKIGIISDTHGYVHPKIFPLFRGVDIILHAGDIGSPEVLSDLRVIAPVTAVYGNTDNNQIRKESDYKKVLNLNGIGIGLIHGDCAAYGSLPSIKEAFKGDKIDIIIYGHTHKPKQEEFEGVLMFNSGYGRESVGFIEIDESGSFKTEIIRF